MSRWRRALFARRALDTRERVLESDGAVRPFLDSGADSGSNRPVPSRWQSRALRFASLTPSSPVHLAPLLVGGVFLVLYLVAGQPGRAGPKLSVTPVAGLLARASAVLPLADPPWRAVLPSALAAAVALALVVRQACDVLGGGPLAALAAAAAAAATGLSLRFFLAGAVPGDAGVAAAFVAGAMLLSERIARVPADTRAGLGLAFVAGLGAGCPAAVAALVWPPAVALTLLALRRGERWPLVAPLLFVAGSGVVLGALVVSPGLGVADVAARLPLASFRTAFSVRPAALVLTAAGLARELGEQIGVVALLLAVVGTAVLLVRARVALAFCVWIVAAALVVAAGLPEGARAAALAAGAVALALPVGAGVLYLAERMGRARIATAVALSIIANVWPALDHADLKWGRQSPATAARSDATRGPSRSR